MLLAGTTMFVLVDVMRMLFPSIAFIYGRAGTTPASQMGLYALGVFLLAGVAARAAGTNATVTTPVALVATIVARTALIASPGGDTQLIASSLGLVAVVGLLGALAASDLPVREASRGLALGLLVSLTFHVILGTTDSIWVGGGLGWLVTAGLIGALGFSWFVARPTSGVPSVRTTIPWLLVGPILAFHGIASSTPSAIRASLGEVRVAPAALLVGASAAGYVAARFLTSSFVRESGGVLVMPPAILAAVLLSGADQSSVAGIASLLSAFVATLTLVMTGEAADDPLASRARRGFAPAAGMLFTFVIVFGYYSSYELQIGFPRGLLPAGGAVLIGMVLFRLKTSDRPDPAPRLDEVGTLAFAPFLVIFVVLASQVRLLPPPRDASLDGLRVMTWNVHMGYDEQGRFNPREIANIIGAQAPDVLVLNEVDRGWLLSGGHDLLGILARDLQMDYVFGPAADAIWGNAILSRLPIENTVVTQLAGDAPMHRSMMTAEIVVGDARLGIVATHLHHLEDGDEIRVEQAEQLSRAASDMQLDGIPVLIMGDLNAEPGSAALAQLSSFTNLVELVTEGASTPTFPSILPVEEIDHIFATPGITATNLDVPRTTASDHLPIALTIHVT